MLKPVTIDNAKPRDKAYALTDGGGLLLEVLPSGTQTWRYKYHLNGMAQAGRARSALTTIAATQLLMLTMTCKSELLRAKRLEFDLDAAQ